MKTTGLDMLGADDLAISVRFKDPVAVAKSQSALASLVSWGAPNFIAEQTYKSAADEISNELKEKKIDAEVKVVLASSLGAALPESHATRTFFVGAGVGGVVAWLLGKLLRR